MDPERHRVLGNYCDQMLESLKAWPSHVGTKGKKRVLCMLRVCNYIKGCTFFLPRPSSCEAAAHMFKFAVISDEDNLASRLHYSEIVGINH